jgi:glutathione S-transferase
MQIYYTDGSLFARIVRIVALELGAACDFVEETAFPPRQVMTLNPAMQVPTLVDGPRTLFGTKLIAEYLMAERPRSSDDSEPPFADGPVRPEHRWHDAQVLVALEAMLSASVARSYLVWTGAEHRRDALIPLDLAARELERASRLLDWLEEQATPEGFIPRTFSLQDVWLIGAIGWQDARRVLDWRGRPRLESIVARYADRDSVRRTMPRPWNPYR